MISGEPTLRTDTLILMEVNEMDTLLRRLMSAILIVISLGLSGSASAQIFTNGSAPPNPENVIDSVVVSDSFLVNNEGCTGASSCVGIGRGTTVELATGGEFLSPPAAGVNPQIRVYSSSRFDVVGGSIGVETKRGGSVRYHSHSEGTISAGSVFGLVVAFDAARVTIDGGSVARNLYSASSSSSQLGIGADVQMIGGDVGGVFVHSGYGVVQIHGGRVRGSVRAFGNGRIIVTGGDIRLDDGLQARALAGPDAMIEFIGNDFELDGVAIDFGPLPLTERTGILRGTLASGDVIEVLVFNSSGTPASSIFVLPAPTPLPDADEDGIPDRHDFCPYVANPLNPDTDLNYIGDDCNTFEDSDGDELADNWDNCPNHPNPEQRDTDRNGIGDACNDHLDADGDEFEDDVDTCPAIPSAVQTDGDGDGRGDICDAYPEDRWNVGAHEEILAARVEISMLMAERDQVGERLSQCLLEPPYLDGDNDGEHDRTDACPFTSADLAIDDRGCSLSQFCADIEAATLSGARRCLHADWQNDESGRASLDCAVSTRAGSKVCTPRGSKRLETHRLRPKHR